MGQLILEQIVQALNNAGFPAERGYPQGKARTIDQPCCAVNLHSADVSARQITARIQVVTPMELGAAVCEQAALEVAEVLNALGGQCSISACIHDSRTGLFSVDVIGTYTADKPQIWINGLELQYVQSFSVWRTLDSTVTTWSEAQWKFRLEEWIPAGQTEQSLPEESFTLVHAGEHGTETFPQATWTYRKREWAPGGIRQTRTGVADSMEISIAE